MLSHHHEVEKYRKLTNLKFIFWPFACHKERFLYKDEKKDIDLFFSGVLQNQYKHAYQSNFRLDCLNQIYHTLLDQRILKKKKFKVRYYLEFCTTHNQRQNIKMDIRRKTIQL